MQTNYFDYINLIKNILIFLKKMNEERYGATSSLVNQQVFIMGGRNKSSVESFNISEANPEWKMQPAMNGVRWCASSAVLNGNK